MKIYGDRRSGNCYKLQLAASLLGIDYQWVDIDILSGDTQAPAFAQLNPNRKIPVLELDDGRCLTESNAILNYLAHGSALLPEDPYARALVEQWQFFEQYSHEPYIAVARFIAVYQGMPAERAKEFRAKQAGGHKALAVMEQQLARTPFLVGEQFSTADVALYAYTHVAPEGGFELVQYPAIGAWLARIEALPNFAAMDKV
ncbi:glutathione S-transferase [Halioglobus japonicus]|uniref:Glutathione S-transferase family protein n=1 Tax=Halioglobus japonicus TaxID=930805 RepID=A0AAP8MFG9_9GAMM|nr:glutathione S-transferase family protein [Halioglobus japonicus]AQA18853.1 glutathione S-transferase [Halioglobus japonicus]PLW86891.1 glutathione S-transferase family protein [Halioglobus japonicus]GHD23504.1 glutathione S-transferase [Halioglobus japonicus]